MDVVQYSEEVGKVCVLAGEVGGGAGDVMAAGREASDCKETQGGPDEESSGGVSEVMVFWMVVEELMCAERKRKEHGSGLWWIAHQRKIATDCLCTWIPVIYGMQRTIYLPPLSLLALLYLKTAATPAQAVQYHRELMLVHCQWGLVPGSRQR